MVSSAQSIRDALAIGAAGALHTLRQLQHQCQQCFVPSALLCCAVQAAAERQDGLPGTPAADHAGQEQVRGSLTLEHTLIALHCCALLCMATLHSSFISSGCERRRVLEFLLCSTFS